MLPLHPLRPTKLLSKLLPPPQLIHLRFPVQRSASPIEPSASPAEQGASPAKPSASLGKLTTTRRRAGPEGGGGSPRDRVFCGRSKPQTKLSWPVLECPPPLRVSVSRREPPPPSGPARRRC